MTTTMWVAAGIAVLLLAVYGLWVAGHFRKSRDLDKQIDLSKMREWKDDEGA